MSGYRVPYSYDEDNMILKMIIKTQCFYILRGNLFWQDLENCECFHPRGRTWQSLKERFQKKIIPNLYNPAYTIPVVQKHIILLGWEQSAKKKALKSEV